jgi:signal transduction histidine kinase
MSSSVRKAPSEIRFERSLSSLSRRRHRKPGDEGISTVSRKLIDAHESERAWLARELHDDVIQRLCLIHLKLGTLKDDDNSPVEFRQAIGNAMEEVSNLSTDIQRLSHRLHSSKLDLLGLAAAAAGYCSEVGDHHKVHIELRAENIPRELPAESSISILRVLQEAVQNAIRHSGSRRFEALLSHHSNEIHLTVRDFGRGFDVAEAIRGRGLGLTSMKERAALVRGELSIESRPYKGTTVYVRMPFRSRVKPACSVG